MKLERNRETAEIYRSAAILARCFVQRWDLYPKQLEDGSYVAVKEPLYPTQLIAHLDGKVTLGTYLLDKKSRARFTVLDADEDSKFEELSQV